MTNWKNSMRRLKTAKPVRFKVAGNMSVREGCETGLALVTLLVTSELGPKLRLCCGQLLISCSYQGKDYCTCYWPAYLNAY